MVGRCCAICAERRGDPYTQDDPAFPGVRGGLHDADLAVSWHHDIETVPTIIRVVDGLEVGRTVGGPATSGTPHRRSPGSARTCR